MALRNLEIVAAVALSTTWLEQHEIAINQLPGGVVVLTELRAFLQQVSASEAPDDSLARLIPLLQAQDRLHDECLRGIYHLLSGLTSLRGQQPWQQVRDRLFPDGLAMTNRSYIEEGGAANLALDRVTEADQLLLNSVPMPGGGTLTDEVTHYQEAGRELLRLGEAQAQLRAKGRPGGNQRALRNRWIRTVRFLQSIIEHQGDESLKAMLLSRLAEVETEADARVRRRAEAATNPDGEGDGQLSDALVEPSL